MVRRFFLLVVLLLPMVVKGQMKEFRLNYKPVMDTVVVDGIDTIIYEVQQRSLPSFADTVPQYCNPYIYSFIFQSPLDSIKYTPTDITTIGEYMRHDSLNLLPDIVIDTLILPSQRPFEYMMIRYMVDNPSSVKYAWHQVPDVEEKIKNRRKRLQEEDDYKELLKMFEHRAEEVSIHKRPEAPKSPWTVTGEENVQLSQLYLSNWIKGGESSMTLISDLRIKAVYDKDKHNWESNIIHKMGITHTSVGGGRLSDDVVDMSSKYGYKAISKWYYSFQNTFKTQLFTSYDKNDEERENPRSAILSPAYIQFIFGMDYKQKDLSLLLSPYTAIITMVADTSKIDQTRYSIDEDKKSKTINGLSVTLNWKKKITPDIVYTTKMEVFYEYFQKDGSKRFDWENIIDMQINRFLSTRLLFELRYYDNESNKFQFKENFSIAFKFRF